MKKTFRTLTFKLSFFASIFLFISVMYSQKLWSDLWMIYGFFQLFIIAAFLIVLVTSTVFWIRQGEIYRFSFLPFGLNIICLILVIMLPLNYIRNRMAFVVYKDDYQVASNIAVTGPLDPGSSLYKLPGKYSSLSVGGGEVDVLDKSLNQAVLFFTFRGMPEGRSGFVHIRKGNASFCIKEMFGDVYKQKELGNRWYYVEAA
ncbi:hypothetical protein [Mucilaginibacter aquatilis]|uniref:Uncharacterized protein n=1 Tax=Mucilaginibacter aquatilis TaxID=1517760 RepID=A0A6I4I845_9SPHI|nr:hypothetical protein [Mucilaginibacter aquatilis]MVN89639.1 hypothetical protein [Mucilaginibacter aquatilis]